MPVNIDTLIAFFDSYVTLAAEEKDYLAHCVKERKMKRKEFFLQEGQTCHHHGFVVSGCIRTYGVDDAGKEHNLQFAAENDWVVDLGSFYSGKPSKLFIETLEPTHLLLIEKDDLIELYKRYAKFVRYPHLSNRLPSVQIASYLGVTPEFLSKVRKDISRA